MSQSLKNPRAIGIVRVSRLKRRGAQSPEVQKRLIVPFAERQGWTLAPEDLLDENEIRGGNVSGGADISRRPGFGPALEQVRAGKAKIVVAADLSRLFRDIDIQRSVIAQIEAAGGEFWTVANGRVSHTTAEGELTANMQGAVNHYQRRYARDKSWLAVELAIEQGKIPWNQTAPGYLRDKDSHLSPDPDVTPVIEEAFSLRAGGATVESVRQHLRGHGIERSYHGTSHLLRDRVYVGEIHFGTTHTPNLSAHPPIIKREVFDAVQRMKVSRGRRAKSERLLARLGVLRCGSCGARMVVGTVRNGAYFMYRCPPTGDCTRRTTISAEIAEKVAKSGTLTSLANVEGRAELAAATRAVRDELVSAQAALDSALRSLGAVVGLDGEAVVIERLTQLRERRDAAQAKVDQMGSTPEVTVTVIDDWDRLSLSEQRELVRSVIERIEVVPAGPRGRWEAIEKRMTVHFVGGEIWTP